MYVYIYIYIYIYIYTYIGKGREAKPRVQDISREKRQNNIY